MSGDITKLFAILEDLATILHRDDGKVTPDTLEPFSTLIAEARDILAHLRLKAQSLE